MIILYKYGVEIPPPQGGDWSGVARVRHPEGDDVNTTAAPTDSMYSCLALMSRRDTYFQRLKPNMILPVYVYACVMSARATLIHPSHMQLF